MTRKQIQVTICSLIAVLTLAVYAAADCRNQASLVATPDGAAIDASGTVDARTQGTQQRFKVSVDAAVADGTTFAVYANNQLAGTITIELGIGELDLNSNNGPLPAAVNPVCGVHSVAIVNSAGTVILSANF